MNLRRPSILALLFLLNAALSAQKDSTTLALLEKVRLPQVHGRIAHLGADFYHGRVFIAAEGDGIIAVLNTRTNAVMNRIGGLMEPHSVAYVKSSNRLFVTSGGDGSLHVFGGTTLKPITTLQLGRDADGIRVDTVQHRVYVGYGDGALAVLDTTGKRLADIELKAHPESFQIAEHQARLFVNVPDAHSIAVVDTTSLKVVAEWPVNTCSGNFPMALDEANHRLFVACLRPARLLVLDMDSGSTLATAPHGWRRG